MYKEDLILNDLQVLICHIAELFDQPTIKVYHTLNLLVSHIYQIKFVNINCFSLFDFFGLRPHGVMAKVLDLCPQSEGGRNSVNSLHSLSDQYFFK